jgi:hypothetical protein
VNRRGFLGALLGGAAALGDPDRAIWAPGRKVISIAAPRMTFEVGDLVTLSGAYKVNPRTLQRAVYVDQATGRRYQYRQVCVVTETVSITDTDALPIWPQIITQGPYRNTDIAYHSRRFALARPGDLLERLPS